MKHGSLSEPRARRVAVVVAVVASASLIAGVAYAVAPTVRKFQATISPCAPKGANPAILTASVTNDPSSTVGLGSAFFDASQANFKNISPSKFSPPIPFTLTVTTAAGQPSTKQWGAFLENDPTYGSGGDKSDLDGIYLVAKTSADYLSAGEKVTVTFPTTVGNPSSATTQTWAVSAWQTTPRTTSFSRVGNAPTTTLSASCPAAKIAFSTLPPTNPARSSQFPVAAKVTDATNVGKAGESVTLTTSDPSITVTTPNPATTNASGIASFTVQVGTKAGSFSVTANDGALTTPPAPFSVPAGSIDHIAFTSGPSTPTTAGGTVNATVTAFDASDNPITDQSQTINLSSPDSPDVGSQSATTDTSGQASFSFTAHKKGSFTLNATDTQVPSGNAGSSGAPLSAPFEVKSGTGISIGFDTEPRDTLVNTNMAEPVTVQELDQSQNVVDDSTGYIGLNLGGGDPSASLSGGCVQLASGVATFTNLQVDTSAANYNLTAGYFTASDCSGTPSMTAGPSSDFNITLIQSADCSVPTNPGCSTTITTDGFTTQLTAQTDGDPDEVIGVPPGTVAGCGDIVTREGAPEFITVPTGANSAVTIYTADSADVPASSPSYDPTNPVPFFPICALDDQGVGHSLPFCNTLPQGEIGEFGCINEQELSFSFDSDGNPHNNLHTVFTVPPDGGRKGP